MRSAPDALTVVTDRGDLRARHVVNATGTWSAPFVPLVEGQASFAGRQLHSAHYRGPADFAGQRVAVVGGGNSGVQIVADLVGVTERVSLVSAGRLRFLPDDVDGRHLFDRATARQRTPDPRDPEAEFVGNIVALPRVREARAPGRPSSPGDVRPDRAGGCRDRPRPARSRRDPLVHRVPPGPAPPALAEVAHLRRLPGGRRQPVGEGPAGLLRRVRRLDRVRRRRR
ncbi:NAD(P)-binding domain-containing protein [Janibacter limosus]|uniref:NAD(P)-binding domain-containing protein n=1 Tax=Janibacter limosus TaxID=53458 RepID=A0AC61U821_9MICO|nr:NAD(P)-binding domain-containing protein [Janibacter limosus]UUZ46190.1 NAD(P)-binding domain-containing protein [Janibacter limosus]